MTWYISLCLFVGGIYIGVIIGMNLSIFFAKRERKKHDKMTKEVLKNGTTK